MDDKEVAVELAPKNGEPVVLLASGGLDSTVLAHWLAAFRADIQPLFLNYGQHCCRKELETLKVVLPPACTRPIHVAAVADLFAGSKSRLIQEPNLWKDAVVADDLVIPYRNLFILAAGAAYAASINRLALYSAFINSNHAREIDATRSYLEQTSRLFGTTGSVAIRMPFRDATKADVARLGVRLGAPVARTYSCQAASEVHCGACPNCIDRLEALRVASEGE